MFLTGIAQAQNPYKNSVRADIPFAFYAGSIYLAPGVYTFNVDPNSRVVFIDKTRRATRLCLPACLPTRCMTANLCWLLKMWEASIG